jgi:hypothetical protein
VRAPAGRWAPVVSPTAKSVPGVESRAADRVPLDARVVRTLKLAPSARLRSGGRAVPAFTDFFCLKSGDRERPDNETRQLRSSDLVTAQVAAVGCAPAADGGGPASVVAAVVEVVSRGRSDWWAVVSRAWNPLARAWRTQGLVSTLPCVRGVRGPALEMVGHRNCPLGPVYVAVAPLAPPWASMRASIWRSFVSPADRSR